MEHKDLEDLAFSFRRQLEIEASKWAQRSEGVRLFIEFLVDLQKKTGKDRDGKQSDESDKQETTEKT